LPFLRQVGWKGGGGGMLERGKEGRRQATRGFGSSVIREERETAQKEGNKVSFAVDMNRSKPCWQGGATWSKNSQD